MITSEDTRKIHEAYNAMVNIEGLNIPYTMSAHYRWEVWLAKAFTSDDLALVVRYMRSRIRKGRREVESLLLRNLIGSADEFSENLSMARAWNRTTRTEPARASVLVATGRTPSQTATTAAPAAKILERPKLAGMLKQWSESNL